MLIAALVVLFGGLILAIRASEGLFSSSMQRESIDARDAAESGLTRILGELNKSHNRGLLVKAGANSDGDSYLWSATDGQSRNPCVSSDSDLTSNPNIGFQSGSTYREVLLDAQGQIIPVATEEERPAALQRAVKSYRLLWVKRQPLRTSDDRPSLRIFEADGHGRVVLAIEGSALRQGRVISSVRLESELQLVPKCCGRSFGGEHGNDLYEPDDAGQSVCIADGWGLLAGAAQNNSGSLTINGVTTITNDADPPSPVNPMFCIASSSNDCAFNPTSTPFTLSVKPPVLPAVPVNPLVADNVAGTINRDSVPMNPALNPFLRCSESSSPEVPASLKFCPGGRVTIDANATTLPSAGYCQAADREADPNHTQELHCNLALLDYSQLAISVINTDKRPLRFYFPIAGDVVRSTGGGTLEHVLAAADEPGDVTSFTMFGCGSCSSQRVKLDGSAGGLELFAWFPHGNITVAGGSAYSGVLWGNRITSSGGVTWTIPSAGVLAALRLAGFGLEDALNPPTFDWVARSPLSFRWFGS